MQVGIAQSRWALHVHCVRSAWKILSQWSGEDREPGKSTVTASESLSLTCDGKEKSVVRELKEIRNVSGRLKFRKKVCKRVFFTRFHIPSVDGEQAGRSPSILLWGCAYHLPTVIWPRLEGVVFPFFGAEPVGRKRHESPTQSP